MKINEYDLLSFKNNNIKIIYQIKNHFESQDPKNIIFNLILRITNYCNFNCFYCDNHNKKIEYFPKKLLKNWLKLLLLKFNDLIFDFNNKKIFNIDFLGGEIFILPSEIILDYLKIFEELKNQFNILHINYFTNLSSKSINTIINNEKIINNINQNNLIISWHPTQISYEKFKENIQKIKEKINNIQIHIIYEKEKELLINSLINYCKSNNIPYLVREINDKTYKNFFEKYYIQRKCFSFVFELNYKNPTILKHNCFKEKIIFNKNINLKKYIRTCSNYCDCDEYEKYIFKKDYKIEKK